LKEKINIDHPSKEKRPVTAPVAHACARKFWPAGRREVQPETLSKEDIKPEIIAAR